MGNFRKRRKIGNRTVTTNRGTGVNTTSTSSGIYNKGSGTGYRITTTTKSNGERYTRTTVRSGGGWFSTTQRSLRAKPVKMRHVKAKPLKFRSGDSDGTLGLVAAGLIVFVLVLNMLIELYKYVALKVSALYNYITFELSIIGNNILSGIEKHGGFEAVLAVILCCAILYGFFKFAMHLIIKNEQQK